MKKILRKIMLISPILLLSTLALANNWQPPTQPTLPLTIPDSLIAMNSSEGMKLLNQSEDKTNALNLLQYFVTQKTTTYCSIASDVMIANALNIPRPVTPEYLPYRLFTQNNVFNPETIKVTTPHLVSAQGQTLEQNDHFLKHLGLQVTAVHVSPSVTFNRFETDVKTALDTKGDYVIVNFLRTRIDEVGGGHFSPLAAYDAKTDRFLLLDVARYKYPAVWVNAHELYQSMQTVDGSSKRYRGYLIIRKE